VLKNREHLRQQIVDSAIGKFPVIGSQLSSTTGERLSGHPWAVAAGVIAALWAGLRAIDAIQHAYDTMWGVPERKRPNFFAKRALGLLMVGILGGGTIAATAVGSVGSRIKGHPAATWSLTALSTIVINSVMLLLSFEVLTNVKAGWSNLRPGALIGGAGLSLLQFGGGIYVEHVVSKANDTYGAFATSCIPSRSTWCG
jgi:uncharacterized BrkB/YihY/UPF0761 family membrane protein